MSVSCLCFWRECSPGCCDAGCQRQCSLLSEKIRLKNELLCVWRGVGLLSSTVSQLSQLLLGHRTFVVTRSASRASPLALRRCATIYRLAYDGTGTLKTREWKCGRRKSMESEGFKNGFLTILTRPSYPTGPPGPAQGPQASGGLQTAHALFFISWNNRN